MKRKKIHDKFLGTTCHKVFTFMLVIDFIFSVVKKQSIEKQNVMNVKVQMVDYVLLV